MDLFNRKAKKQVVELYEEAQKYVELSNKSRTISGFMEYYSKLLKIIQELRTYEDKIKFNGSLTNEYTRLIQEEQRHIQQALRRELSYKLECKTDLDTGYENFCAEIKRYRNKFSKETMNVAEECRKELFSKITTNKAIKQEDVLNHIFTFKQIVDNEMTNIDLMYHDGWQFEQYCAELLLFNGFIKTEVTQKSNDYGVDVIAVNPDGVKYAIQCKCYSNKLGNTPVQEIVAGMKVYNCQVGVVLTNNYFTNNAQILADNNNILLWDRDKLKDMVEIKKKKELNANGDTAVLPHASPSATPTNNYDGDDELLPEAIDLALSLGKISTSMIQRGLGVGYSRACRILDQMEARGIISPANGSKPRDVIIKRNTYL